MMRLRSINNQLKDLQPVYGVHSAADAVWDELFSQRMTHKLLKNEIYRNVRKTMYDV